MANSSKPDTADKVILAVLVYEFRTSDHHESHATIKKRLRYYKFGPYDQDRVEVLRRLKDSLKKEIGRQHRSRYCLGSHGKYAAMEDFDVPQIVDDYCVDFPEVERCTIEWFVPFSVFAYYLR